MSLENARRFIEAASQDHALQERLSAAREPAEAVRLAVEASSERGLPFTADEFLASIGPASGERVELNDGQLGAVAGGGPDSTPEQLAKIRWVQKIFRPAS